MIVKFCGKGVFDVFVGKGWDNWTRFEIISAQGKKYLHKLTGQNVPAQVMGALRSRFTR